MMSLIEIMLHNKLIVLSIGVSGLLLAVAVAMAVVVRVRAMMQARKARQKAAALVVLEGAAPAAETLTTAPAVKTGARSDAKPSAQAAAIATPAAEPETSPALKTIIANAFIDDELTARRSAMLTGLEAVDIHALSNLTVQVRDALKARSRGTTA